LTVVRRTEILREFVDLKKRRDWGCGMLRGMGSAKGLG